MANGSIIMNKVLPLKTATDESDGHTKAVRDAQMVVVRDLLENGKPLFRQLRHLSEEQNTRREQSSDIQKDLSVIVNDMKTRLKEIKHLDDVVLEHAGSSEEIEREMKTSAEFKITMVTEMTKFEDVLEETNGKSLLFDGAGVEKLTHIDKMEVAKCVFGIIMTFVSISGNVAIIQHYKMSYEDVQLKTKQFEDNGDTMKVIAEVTGVDIFGNHQRVNYIVYYSLAIVWLFSGGVVQAITFVILVRRNEKIASVFISEDGKKNEWYWCMIAACVLLIGPVVLNGYIIYLLCKQREGEEIEQWRMLLVNFKLGEIVAGTVPQLAMNIANMTEVSNSIIEPYIETKSKNAMSKFMITMPPSLRSFTMPPEWRDLYSNVKDSSRNIFSNEEARLMSTLDTLVGTTSQKFQLAQSTITSTLGLTTWAFKTTTPHKFKRDAHHPVSAFFGLFVLIGCSISTSITSVIFNPARYNERSIPIALNFMNLILIAAFIAAPWKR